MICEFRIYSLKARSLAELEKRYAEAYGHRREYSPLAAFWHTAVGPLNEIIHVWGYTDFADNTLMTCSGGVDQVSSRKRISWSLARSMTIRSARHFDPGRIRLRSGISFSRRTYSVSGATSTSCLATASTLWHRFAIVRPKGRDSLVLRRTLGRPFLLCTSLTRQTRGKPGA